MCKQQPTIMDLPSPQSQAIGHVQYEAQQVCWSLAPSTTHHFPHAIHCCPVIGMSTPAVLGPIGRWDIHLQTPQMA